MAHKIIGTAGHIDHGKSTLVRMLTGTDPDRLAEEQERGMTIDLGFAFLNDEIAFIDVPGHEKFIKNMVAGVSTVDLAMLVIAADDGVMPQTREHLDILKILQLKRGLVALTKIDMVEEEWLDIVEDDIRSLVRGTFLQDAPIQRVSSLTGAGLSELRERLIRLAAEAEPRQDRGLFWLPIDRVFTIKGHGTVITGSILSGSVRVGDTCELLPQQRPLRIRGIQTHGRTTEQASLGDRAALNLMNVATDELARGDVLATPGFFQPTRIFDAKLTLLKTTPKFLANRTRVRLHLGTREIMARLKLLGADKVEPGQSAFVQLVLESPAVAQKRDPFVIRQYSPQITIGGGIILDAFPKPHKRSEQNIIAELQKIENLDPTEIIVSVLAQQNMPIKMAELVKQSGFEAAAVESILKTLASQGLVLQIGAGLYLHKNNLERLKQAVVETLAAFHQKEPLRAGLKKAILFAQTAKNMPAVFEAALGSLVKEGKIFIAGDVVKLAGHEIKLSAGEQKIADDIYAIFTAAPFATPPVKIIAEMLHLSEENVQRGLNALLGLDKIVRFEGDIYFPKIALKTAEEKLRSFPKEEITVGEFRELLSTSRKFAMPLLAYFDDLRLTERVGESRLIKKG